MINKLLFKVITMLFLLVLSKESANFKHLIKGQKGQRCWYLE